MTVWSQYGPKWRMPMSRHLTVLAAPALGGVVPSGPRSSPSRDAHGTTQAIGTPVESEPLSTMHSIGDQDVQNDIVTTADDREIAVRDKIRNTQ